MYGNMFMPFQIHKAKPKASKSNDFFWCLPTDYGLNNLRALVPSFENIIRSPMDKMEAVVLKGLGKYIKCVTK